MWPKAPTRIYGNERSRGNERASMRMNERVINEFETAERWMRGNPHLDVHTALSTPTEGPFQAIVAVV